jgi:Brp/Blh family beta-carotene 15,15'-monooxygenase
MVLLNLPHGAVENWLNLRGRSLAVGSAYVAAYGVLAAGFAGFYLAAPVAGVALAVAVAAAKTGSGDLAVLDAAGAARHLQGRGRRLLAGGVRGGAVMAFPMAAHPATFESFAGVMVALADPAALDRLAAAFDAGLALLTGSYGAAAAGHAGLGLWTALRRPDRRRAALTELAELALLLGFFAVVPVLVAVGLYFPLWYSARQMGRALRTAGPGAAAAGRAAGWGLAGLLAGTAGAAAGFAWLLPGAMPPPQRLSEGVAFWTLLIAAVALPHVVVGGWLDRGRGLWRTAA